MTVMDLHTLVDCGCKAKVYSDGSGVDIEYCDLHRSAPVLLEALDTLLNRVDHKRYNIRKDFSFFVADAAARTAIAKARGQYVR